MNGLNQKIFNIIVAVLLGTQMILAQQPTEKTFAFRLASGSFITFVAGGGLDASGKEMSRKQIFAVEDINGGEINDGDRIKIRAAASVWHENKANNKMHRVPARGANEAECTLKIRVKGKNILLETASGRFITTSVGGNTLITTDKREEARLWEAIPAQAPPSPAKPE